MSDRAAAFVHETVREKISFEEYLRQYEGFEGGRTEWLAGEVAIYPMPNNVTHNNARTLLSGRWMILGATAALLSTIKDDWSHQPCLVLRLTPKFCGVSRSRMERS